MLGDYLSEAQLRTLVRDYQVEQKYGSMGSPAPKRRKSELSGVDAVRDRVQRQRHYRQAGISRKPYLSQSEAIARYERRRERLERGEEMFFIGQGESTRKKSDIRATAVKGGRPGHGGRISHRPTIGEDRCAPIHVKSERKATDRVFVGYRV